MQPDMINNPTDNSSLALERLRQLVSEMPDQGERKLPTERTLAGSFGISRRAVRRALEVLEAEGQVWRRQGSGTYLGPRPADPGSRIAKGHVDFAELMEARLRIEPQLAQLASLRATPEHVARMHELLLRLDQAEDTDSRELWDSALHHEIARAAGNRFFLMVFDAMDRSRLDDAWRNIRERARSRSNLALYRTHHHDIVSAIASHDPVRAGEAMLAHIQALNDNLFRQTSSEGLADAS